MIVSPSSLRLQNPHLPSTSLAAESITHGPVLGRPGSDTMSIWVRTASPATVRAQFGPPETTAFGRIRTRSRRASPTTTPLSSRSRT